MSCLENDTALACYIFDTHHPIFIIFVDNDVILLSTVFKYFSPSHFCVIGLLYVKGICPLLEHVGGSGKSRLCCVVRWLLKEAVLQMFKVTTSCPLTCTQPYSAQVNGFVDDALQDAPLCVNEALLQVVCIADERLVLTLSHPTPDPLVNRV